MFNSLIDAFGAVQSFFYELLPNYGVSIILITVAIRLLLYPLTAKQARSMAKMQKVQPEIKKIQERYKHDRQKLNEELMAFYREHQINPLAGCLPLVLQFPIFIALFQVLRSPAKHIPLGSDLFGALCPGVDTAKACVDSPGLPKGLTFLSMDLSRGANADHSSVLDAIPFFLLIALVIGSGYYQSRQMTRLQKGRATPQTQMMTRIFPVFFGVISYTLPAGVVLYFFVSNMWQIGQQALVFGRDAEPAAATKKGDRAAPPRGDGRAPSRAEKAKARPVVEAEARAVEGSQSDERDVDPAAGEPDATPTPARATPGPDGEQRRPAAARPHRAQSRKRKKRKRRR